MQDDRAVAIVEMLVNAEADCIAEDCQSRTPLMYAASCRGVSAEIVRMLLEGGADATKESCNRETAHAQGVKEGNSAEILEMLVPEADDE